MAVDIAYWSLTFTPSGQQLAQALVSNATGIRVGTLGSRVSLVLNATRISQ